MLRKRMVVASLALCAVVVGAILIYVLAPDLFKRNGGQGNGTSFFSFEEDMQRWEAKALDLDLANSTIEWSIARSQDRWKDGHSSLRFYLENWNDKGKIWIERRFAVEPNAWHQVSVRYAFASADWGDANFFVLITGVLQEPPRTPGELVYQGYTGNGAGSDVGYVWLDKNYSFSVESGSTGELYVVIGVWGVWETPRTYYFDAVEVVFS